MKSLPQIIAFAILMSGCTKPWYTGEWTVVDAEFPGISALSADEAQQWFGATAIYAAGRFEFGDVRCDAPQYNSRVLTEADFRSEYRASFSRLGIDGEATELLRTTCAGLTSFPGMTLIRASADSIYIPWDGVFFRLEK